MANAAKVLFRGAADTTVQTLYTVPASTTTVVTDIVVTNTDSSASTFTLELDDVEIAEEIAIDANDSVSLSLKQVLNTTETIKGLAGAITVNFHISGMEIA